MVILLPRPPIGLDPLIREAKRRMRRRRLFQFFVASVVAITLGLVWQPGGQPRSPSGAAAVVPANALISLGATMKCLAAAGYSVANGDRWAPKPRGPQSRWITISSRQVAYLGAFFAPTAAAASDWAAAHDGEGTEVDRNVAFDIGGGNNEAVGDDIRACLRTS